MRVYLDSDEGRQTPLEAHSLTPEGWNGWAVPVVSASAFTAFVRAWRDRDPNGVWGRVWVDGESLCYLDSDRDDSEVDRWSRVGTADDGTALYRVDGWTFDPTPVHAVDYMTGIPVCGAEWDGVSSRLSEDPEDVTCPACL